MKSIFIAALLLASQFFLVNTQNLLAQASETKIDSDIQKEVINNICNNLKNYIFPEKAKLMIDDLREKEKNKKYANLLNPNEFASQLTSDLQKICKDKHVNVRYSSEKLPPDQPDESPREIPAGYIEFLAKKNFGFEKVEILDGNVGYIKLNGFTPGDLASETAAAAMNFVANSDALIFDLRDNTGGLPDLIVFITSYLFDAESIHLNDFYRRSDDKTVQTWTTPYVQGKRYGKNKDVFILTSNKTFSAAEEFSYDLQSLKRAKIIGETTGGGANPGKVYRLNDHFSIFIPDGYAINPITKTNWEGVGVKPDLEVSKEKALTAAHITALKSLFEKETNEQKKADFRKKIDFYEKDFK